jgi:hypothetical protein
MSTPMGLPSLLDHVPRVRILDTIYYILPPLFFIVIIDFLLCLTVHLI